MDNFSCTKIKYIGFQAPTQKSKMKTMQFFFSCPSYHRFISSGRENINATCGDEKEADQQINYTQS